MISDIFKFSLQGFYQAFNQLLSCQLVTGMVRSFKQEFQYNEVITQADILAVSDGTGLVAAHACAANNLIAGQAKLLAASLYPCGEMGKLIGFRFHIVKILLKAVYGSKCRLARKDGGYGTSNLSVFLYTMKPIKNSIPIRELQTLLRQWRRKGLKESALLKVLELYLGLPNYMNEQGMYPVHFFYDLAMGLKFRTVTMMLEAVRQSESFGMEPGENKMNIASFYSPLWKDLPADLHADLHANLQVGSNIYNINNNLSSPPEINPSEEGRKFFHEINTHPEQKTELLAPLIGYLNKHMVHLDLHEVSPTPAHILERADRVRRTMPIQYLVIDPYLFMEVETGRYSSETQAIKAMLTQVQTWGRAHGVWVVIVAHPRKLMKLWGSNESEDIDMYTIAGSANWANLADFILSITRIDEEDKRYTRLDMLKVRDQDLCRKGSVIYVRQPCGRYDERESVEQVTAEMQGRVLERDTQPWITF